MTDIDMIFDTETTEFLCATAEKRGIPVHAYLNELVRECMREALYYERARLAFMEMLYKPLKGTFPEGRLPKREELYDRPYHIR